MDQNDPAGIGLQSGDHVINTASEPVSGNGADGMTSSFEAELAKAMQAAAELERERLAAIAADDAAEHVEKTRARAAVETEELRRLAEEDIERIRTWVADETERIRWEAERRTEERRKDLEAVLAEHDSIIATEIESVGIAIRDYRSTLDRFFDSLGHTSNLVDIARRAGSLPAKPDLDDIRDAARASAVPRLAEAGQDASDDASDDGPGDPEAGPESPADGDHANGDAGNDEWTAAGAGLAVMDPDAIGRSEDLPEAPEAPEALEETGIEAAPEPVSGPFADPDEVPVRYPIEAPVAQSLGRSVAAVRLLRSIAPWTAPVAHDGRDRGAENSGSSEF